MSETAIFIVGAIVFAVTVYGTVMAGGIALTRAEIEQNPERENGFADEDLNKRFAFRGKY
jgi:hypothetical protein